MDLSKTDLELNAIDENKISDYILLLPRLGKIGYIHSEQYSSHYAIDLQWNELNCHMEFVKHRAPNCNCQYEYSLFYKDKLCYDNKIQYGISMY